MNEQFTEHMKDNPCRGLIVGRLGSGDVVQLSWIMGRSQNSQNRVYVVEDGVVKTKAFDESKVEDPSLIIYNTMRSTANQLAHVVSNGDQTDTVMKRFGELGDSPRLLRDYFFNALHSRHCEPDAPVFTPRITGYSAPNASQMYLSILAPKTFQKTHWRNLITEYEWSPALFKENGMSDKEANEAFLKAMQTRTRINVNFFPTEHHELEVSPEAGHGYCITTYRPGSKELPTFRGDPIPVELKGGLEDVMSAVWETLEPEWKVGLAGKRVSGTRDYETGAYETEVKLINKHEVAQ